MAEYAFFLGWATEYKSWEMILQLYKILIRAHRLLCVVWSPHHKKDVVVLDSAEKIHQDVAQNEEIV